MNRRKFLRIAVNSGGVIVAGGIAVPAVVTLLSPGITDEKGEVWKRVGALESFPPNSTKAALVEIERNDWAQSLRTQLLYVRRKLDGEVEVFSRNCTDLSCPVVWDPGSNTFLCPCHGGIFNRDGEPIAGPPNRPLYRYNHRIRDGFLEVDVRSVPPIS